MDWWQSHGHANGDSVPWKGCRLSLWANDMFYLVHCKLHLETTAAWGSYLCNSDPHFPFEFPLRNQANRHWTADFFDSPKPRAETVTRTWQWSLETALLSSTSHDISPHSDPHEKQKPCFENATSLFLAAASVPPQEIWAQHCQIWTRKKTSSFLQSKFLLSWNENLHRVCVCLKEPEACLSGQLQHLVSAIYLRQ